MSASMPVTPRHKSTREEKIAYALRLLDSDPDIIAAVHALKRLLQSLGTDWDGLASGFEKILNNYDSGGSLTDEQKVKIQAAITDAHAAGYAEGVKAAEARQHGTGAFRNIDGQIEWTEVALFLQREKHRLPDKHHEFIDDMASRTVYGREPTPKQHQYLHSLFHRLGGKIT